ncbi:hypothetical protein [Nitrospirillum amazonense]|uniref:hypothetical protein n=1 Tax=Nitrospirillum amazonense TaxID=28077 RepID=UPI002412D652|nr:hypothetical protein [Nitrospirillum amazonense]MDG3443979.1 hypothetical protein [Nitrospirillum amazonense]
MTEHRSRLRINKSIEHGNKRHLVICGSMSFYSYMRQVQHYLDSFGVPCLLPDPDDDRILSMANEQSDAFKRKVSLAHMKRIQNIWTYGILVTNFDKNGIYDYIGPSTFAEIAIAATSGKAVFLLNGIPSMYEHELMPWRVIPLHGHLDPVIKQYELQCRSSHQQLAIPLHL